MVDASATMTAARLSRVIEKQTGVPPGSFALYYGSRPMRGTLDESGVASGSTIELKFRGRGGGSEPPATNSSEVEIETRPASMDQPPATVARGPTAMMRGYDRDGDGNFSRDEVRAMAADFIKEKKTRRLATKAAIAMGLLILLVVGLNAGLTAAIVFLSKDLKVTTGGILTPDDKQVAKVAVAKQFIPLGLASYMTQSELLTIDKVVLSKSIFNVTDNTSTPYQSSYTVLGYEWFSHHKMYFTLSDGGRVTISDGNAWCVHIPTALARCMALCQEPFYPL